MQQTISTTPPVRMFLGEEFDGIISGVSAFGFWVETVAHKCEGLVSVRDLGAFDEFRHDETSYALVGMRTGKIFNMGDKIKIKVVAANLIKRQLDYEWVMEETKTKGNNQKAMVNNQKLKGKMK